MSSGSGGAPLLQSPSGEVIAAGSGTPFGNLHLGYNAYGNQTGKSQMLLLDRTTSAANLVTASHGEQFTLDASNVTESGLQVVAIAPASAAGGTTSSKAAINGLVVTSEVSNYGTVTYPAVGLAGQAVTQTGNTQGFLNAVQAYATVSASSDATSQALFAASVNNGTAVSTVNTALSKYVQLLSSSGVAKNTAFSYSIKQISPGPVAAVNCSHGHLVDSASVDANAFGVVSGTTPTVIWAVQPTGKETVSQATVTIADQTGTPALTTPVGAVTITALTLAQATAVTVSCTCDASLGVTSASKIFLTIQNQTGSASGLMAISAIAVTSNAFGIRIGNTTAATAYGGGAFSVAYRIVN